MVQFVLGPNFKHFKGTPQDEDERSWLRIVTIRFIYFHYELGLGIALKKKVKEIRRKQIILYPPASLSDKM